MEHAVLATPGLWITARALYLRCLCLPATENSQTSSTEGKEVPVSWGQGEPGSRTISLEGWANFAGGLSGLVGHACIHPLTCSAAVP